MTDENPKASARPASEQPAQKTDEEIGDNLYDPTLTYAPALKSGFDRMRDVGGLSEEEATQQVEHASRFFSDARIPVQEATILHGLFVNHILDQPADDATLKQWTIDSRRQLRETYGKDADSRLAAVKEYLDRYPGMRELLTKSGLGSHPRVVMSLAEQAPRFRAKGK